MLLLIFNVIKSCRKIRVSDCRVKFPFAPQMASRIAQAHLWSVSEKNVSRFAFENLKCIFDAHSRRQSCHQVHMVRHDLYFDEMDAMAACGLADARFRKIFMVELAEYLVSELCAPYYVPK